MKISAILKGTIDAYGNQPVCIRITQGNDRKHIPTNLRVKPTQFTDGKVNNKHPESKYWNGVLTKKMAELHMETSNPVKQAPATCFYMYCIARIKKATLTKSASSITLDNQFAIMTRFKEYAPKLSLTEIDVAFLDAFTAHQFAKGNKQNTVHQYLGFCKAIMISAIKQKLVTVNPFDEFEMIGKEETNPHYLQADQVDALFNYSYQPNKKAHYKKAATWFSIGCLTALRFGDMKAFDKKKHIVHTIKGARLVLYTKKTGTVVSIPFSPKLRSLFEQINYQPLTCRNTCYNQHLAVIGKRLSIDKINAHMSRHTAAMTWADAGLPVEICQELMGHTDIKTTQIYYKISGNRIDTAFAKLDYDAALQNKIDAELSAAM